MKRAWYSALGTLLVGVGCLAAGLAVGRWLPRRDVPRVWTGDSPPTGSAPASAPSSFADVVAKASPGVVTLRARLPATAPTVPGPKAEDSPRVEDPPKAEDPLFGSPVFRSESGYRSGSGFVVHSRGLVVTSLHVVAGAAAIEVLVPGHPPLVGHVVGEDQATDLALVRLDDAPRDLTVLAFGRSEELRAGDWIVAVGNPFGFAQTVTAGIVSFVGRQLPHSDFALTNDFVQFSAPVNPGSSGCPVLDLQGRVVGVTTQAARSAQGISFAVPSRTVKWALDAMEKSRDGRVRRGYLGIEFASRPGRDDGGRRHQGAVIVGVTEGQPGHRAGLRKGDVVLKVDGETVEDASVLHEHIVRGEPGSRIALQLLRGGRVQDPIEAVLGEVGGPKRPEIAN